MFQSEFVFSQIWFYLILGRWVGAEKISLVWICNLPNLVILIFKGRGRGYTIKVAQNALKHILILEFFKFDEFCKWPHTSKTNQPNQPKP